MNFHTFTSGINSLCWGVALNKALARKSSADLGKNCHEVALAQLSFLALSFEAVSLAWSSYSGRRCSVLTEAKAVLCFWSMTQLNLLFTISDSETERTSLGDLLKKTYLGGFLNSFLKQKVIKSLLRCHAFLLDRMSQVAPFIGVLSSAVLIKNKQRVSGGIMLTSVALAVLTEYQQSFSLLGEMNHVFSVIKIPNEYRGKIYRFGNYLLYAAALLDFNSLSATSRLIIAIDVCALFCSALNRGVNVIRPLVISEEVNNKLNTVTLNQVFLENSVTKKSPLEEALNDGDIVVDLQHCLEEGAPISIPELGMSRLIEVFGELMVLNKDPNRKKEFQETLSDHGSEDTRFPVRDSKRYGNEENEVVVTDDLLNDKWYPAKPFNLCTLDLLQDFFPGMVDAYKEKLLGASGASLYVFDGLLKLLYKVKHKQIESGFVGGYKQLEKRLQKLAYLVRRSDEKDNTKKDGSSTGEVESSGSSDLGVSERNIDINEVLLIQLGLAGWFCGEGGNYTTTQLLQLFERKMVANKNNNLEYSSAIPAENEAKALNISDDEEKSLREELSQHTDNQIERAPAGTAEYSSCLQNYLLLEREAAFNEYYFSNSTRVAFYSWGGELGDLHTQNNVKAVVGEKFGLKSESVRQRDSVVADESPLSDWFWCTILAENFHFLSNPDACWFISWLINREKKICDYDPYTPMGIVSRIENLGGGLLKGEGVSLKLGDWLNRQYHLKENEDFLQKLYDSDEDFLTFASSSSFHPDKKNTNNGGHLKRSVLIAFLMDEKVLRWKDAEAKKKYIPNTAEKLD